MDWDVAPTHRSYWEVRVCTSTEGWGLGCDTYTTIAHSFSSLDGVLTEDGFVLMGIPDAEYLSAWGFDSSLSSAYFLSTPDGEHWGTHMEPLAGLDDDWAIDTAMVLLEDDQPGFVYYRQPEDCGTEPLECPGSHQVKLAPWDGEAFTELAEPIYERERLVDPTVLPFDGGYHLFATCDGDVCHATASDPAHFEHDEAFLWSGVQVPHANAFTGELMVVAQGGGGWPPPRTLVMNDDGSFPTEDDQLYSDEDNLSFFGGSCTSPVLLHWNDVYYTFCAVIVNPW